MKSENENTLILHLETLRKTLLKCLFLTALIFPVCYFLTPALIDWLVEWCFPFRITLHFFMPIEVFLIQLKLGIIISLMIAYPWNIYQIWSFLMPGLYANEQKMLGKWIICSSVLFFSGIVFCVWKIIPLLMNFSLSFTTEYLQPTIGLATFLQMTGWLSLAFGIMFQSPILVILTVNMGLITVDNLKQKRPYVIVGILILSAVLTPPDVISQIMLALPTWILFEIGLYLSSRLKKENDD
ncbi:MAG: twin-arginine translocase subunit TatC [Candidatus Omnitrophica bacterium]|nr:twin-arginine translocase subunit TatC [Candidatus Omnitrophota bacterium]